MANSNRRVNTISSLEMEGVIVENLEVYGVIRTFNGDKVRGSDGFSLAFFQSCWDVVKGDMLAMFNEFAKRGKFAKSLNVTYISMTYLDYIFKHCG